MTAAPFVIPVTLGCCHEAVRCLLCPPPPRIDAELVEALVQATLDEREPGDGEPVVRFFGGRPPTDDEIAAVGGLPFEARVRPDLLDRPTAARLAAAGCRAVELDALTFHDPSLQAVGRAYRAARVEEMSRALPELGLAVGGVLAPGLPRSTSETALHDAHRAAAVWSFVRLHPVLVLDRSRLRRLHEAQLYTPLTLEEAVGTCAAMLDVLDAAGVRVLRVGLQPGPDGLGRAVAGPHEPGFRELVEERRTLARLLPLVSAAARAPGAELTVRCAPADRARTRGRLGSHVRQLRAACGLRELHVVSDPHLARGALVVQEGPPPPVPPPTARAQEHPDD